MNKPTYDQLQSQLAAALAKNAELEQQIAVLREALGIINKERVAAYNIYDYFNYYTAIQTFSKQALAQPFDTSALEVSLR